MGLEMPEAANSYKSDTDLAAEGDAHLKLRGGGMPRGTTVSEFSRGVSVDDVNEFGQRCGFDLVTEGEADRNG